MTLDEATEVLYGGDPDAFVARRKELVTEARQAKDRELATAIGALRRPTRTAWLVNLLAREAPDEVAGLLALGADLATAQRERDGARLRTLSQQRRTTVDTLTRRAVRLGAAHGHPAAESATAEVGQTLQAALADPDVADQVRHGRLAQAAAYGGFGPEDLSAALAASIPVREPGPAAKADDAADTAEQERRERERLAREETERAARAAAEAELEQARTVAAEATDAADRLAGEVERLRTELAAAERTARDARARVKDLEATLTSRGT